MRKKDLKIPLFTFIQPVRTNAFKLTHMLTSSMQLSHSKKGAIAPGKREESKL